MQCKKCGAEISFNSKFCSECGAKVIDESVRKVKSTIQLKCKTCGGVLTIDADREVVSCPYCDSKELIEESDAVTIERIKSRIYKEVEFGKLQYEKEKEKRIIEKEAKEENERQISIFQKGKLSKILIIAFIISILCTFNCFSSGKVLAGLIAFVQASLYGMSWLMGMQFIKGKIPRMYILFALIGFLMIILYLRAMDVGSGSKTSPTISKEQQTNESEGIYTYQIRNYVGKNVASVGKISGSSVVDTYGSGELRIVFVTEDGMFINPSDEEQKKQYVVVEQSLEKDSNITIVHLRNSSGEPYSNLVDYQSYEEIILYVAPIGNNDTFKPVVEKINPTLDRHKFYVRDYVGKNAASFGKVNNSNRTDSYGAGGLRISFISEDGTYIEASNINELKNYIIIAQDIKANTELNLDYETNSLDEEYHNLIRNQNYEEINLTVRKLDESIVEKMLEIEDADKNSY